MRKTKSERKRKRRVWLRVIIEIVFTSCGILSTTLPEPYDVYALLTIGVLRVILSAVQRERKSEEPPMIVYCNGEKEPHIEKPVRVPKRTNNTGAILKSAYEKPKTKKPVKTTRTAHITVANTKKGVKV